MSEGKASDIRFLFYRYAFFLLRGKANGIREIFADLEAKLHEIVCRETTNTKRRLGKNLVESELILRLRELESMLSRSMHHIQFLESPRTGTFAFQICLHGCQTERMIICRDKVENQGFSSL